MTRLNKPGSKGQVTAHSQECEGRRGEWKGGKEEKKRRRNGKDKNTGRRKRDPIELENRRWGSNREGRPGEGLTDGQETQSRMLLCMV